VGGMIGDAGEDVGEPRLRVDVVHLGRDDEAKRSTTREHSICRFRPGLMSFQTKTLASRWFKL
jgi:hypothetical protein